MTKEQLNKQVKSIIRDVERLEETVRIIEAINPERFPEEYGTYHADAVRRAEWLTCRLRHLLYQSTPIRKNEYLLRAAETLGIKFCNRDGIFQLTLPGIVLSSNRNRPSEFLFDPLIAALFEWLRNHLLTQYHRCVVCFVLFFDREICERVLPDTSNPELKLYMDAVAACLMIDDSPKYMDLHLSVELGDRHAVEMFIMEPDCFPQWLREREQNREKLAPAEP